MKTKVRQWTLKSVTLFQGIVVRILAVWKSPLTFINNGQELKKKAWLLKSWQDGRTIWLWRKHNIIINTFEKLMRLRSPPSSFHQSLIILFMKPSKVFVKIFNIVAIIGYMLNVVGLLEGNTSGMILIFYTIISYLYLYDYLALQKVNGVFHM